MMHILPRSISTALLITATTAFSPFNTVRYSTFRHSSTYQTMTKLHTSGPYPELCVFDLDACFWDQEMYTLSKIPDETNVVRGDLGRVRAWWASCLDVVGFRYMRDRWWRCRLIMMGILRG
jgi:hypothetical protein